MPSCCNHSMETKRRKPGEAQSGVIRDLPLACQDERAAVLFVEKQRWGDTPRCPRCDSEDVVMVRHKDTACSNRFLWRCHRCKRQFTVRIGTIMEDSRIPLRVWCHAFWRACSSRKGVSAKQISRECGITYKSALFLMHRIRYAMTEPDSKEKLHGTVEVDETYVGGKPRNKGKNKRARATKKTPPVV